MRSITTSVPIKRGTIEAKIIRANGTVEDLGVVSYYNSNPFKQLFWNVSQFLKGVFHG